MGLARIELRQFGKRLIEEQDFAVHRLRRDALGVVEAHPQCGSGATYGPMRSGVINQNSSHHVRRHTEKVCAILPRHTPLADQSDVGLMDQCRWLQRVIWSLVP